MTQQQASMNQANQFIGSRISLVSKAEIRYEGVLYALDLREATISLAKVKSFGTEDRATDRPVPAKDDVYEFIIFRGSDIKCIDVLEPPKAPGAMPCGLPQDPAIIEVSHFRTQTGHGAHHNNNFGTMDHSTFRYGSHGSRMDQGVFEGLLRGGRGNHQGGPRGRRRNSQDTNHGGGRPSRRRNPSGGRNNNRNNSAGRRSRQDNGNGNRNGSRGGGGGGGRGNSTPNRNRSDSNRRAGNNGPRSNNNYDQPRGPRGVIPAQQPPKVTFPDEYDFEKSNEELKNAMEKLKLGEDDKAKDGERNAENEETTNKKEDPMIYYDRDKFFDNISCETLEQQAKGRQPRPDWRAERKMNAETFGLPFNPDDNYRGRNNGGYNNRMRNNHQRSNSRGGNQNQNRYNNSYNGGGGYSSSNNGNRYRNNNGYGYGNRAQSQRN